LGLCCAGSHQWNVSIAIRPSRCLAGRDYHSQTDEKSMFSSARHHDLPKSDMEQADGKIDGLPMAALALQ